MKKKSQLLLQNIKKLIFSDECSVCKRIVSPKRFYLCEECFTLLKIKANLKKEKDFYYVYYYDEEIRTILRDYKLKNRRGLGKDIAQFIKKPLKKVILDNAIDVIIPVPISPKRMLERGFNQVEELLDNLKIDYNKIIRIKDTKPLSSMKQVKERKKILHNSFEINLDLENKNILIVDDIITTGSTINEIKREIYKLQNPKNVYVFSVAMAKRFLQNKEEVK